MPKRTKMNVYERTQVVKYTCPDCGREYEYAFMACAVPPSTRVCDACVRTLKQRRQEARAKRAGHKIAE